MVYSRNPTARRPRSSLRKRHTFRGFRKYYNFSTGNDDAIYDRNKVLSSGFTVGETGGCLDKAWVGFRTAKRLENYSDMKLYASVIQRLEKELKIEVNDFSELGLCARDLEDTKEEEEEED
ncbi:hypothetical protein BH18THE2_BH18THE2_25900 [soil metagenome]